MTESSPSSSPSGRRWTPFGAVWTLLDVRLGLVATALITLGSLTPAYLPQASPLWPVLRQLGLAGSVGRIGGTVLTVSGVFLLIHAWLHLRRHRFSWPELVAVVVWWSLPFLIAPPIFSHDVYSYAAQGWMIHNGQNPYDGGPSLVPGAFSDYAPWVWRYSAAPYGPLALQISHLIVNVSGGVPWLAAWLMRLPALAGVACVLVFLPRIARHLGVDPQPVMWFACLNPLLLVDYVGGGHNDAWMMGLVMVALWLATRPKWWPLAALLIAAAASIKQPAILAALFLPLVTRPFDRWRQVRLAAAAVGRSLLGLGIAVAGFLLISWACGLGFGWIGALTVPGDVGSISPSYLIGDLLQRLIDPDGDRWLTWTSRVVMGLGAALIIGITCRQGPRRPLKALAWSWIVAAFAMSALHSWYLLWGGLLLPLSRPARRTRLVAVLVVVLMLAYATVNLGDRNGLASIVAACAVLVVWLVYLAVHHRAWALVRERSPREAGETGSGEIGSSGTSGQVGEPSGASRPG